MCPSSWTRSLPSKVPSCAPGQILNQKYMKSQTFVCDSVSKRSFISIETILYVVRTISYRESLLKETKCENLNGRAEHSGVAEWSKKSP